MWLTLLGALVAMHDGAHLGMTSVIARLPIAGQRICRFVSDLLMLACCILLATAPGSRWSWGWTTARR